MAAPIHKHNIGSRLERLQQEIEALFVESHRLDARIKVLEKRLFDLRGAEPEQQQGDAPPKIGNQGTGSIYRNERDFRFCNRKLDELGIGDYINKIMDTRSMSLFLILLFGRCG